MKKIRFFKEILAEKFHTPLHRIAFDLGLSCPNRRNGVGPCAFCSGDGARSRHLHVEMDLEKQAESGREYVKNRYGSNGPYLAYFQAFTNTFAPVEVLRTLYTRALATGDYKAVIIATRPDCLGEDVLDLLCELKERYELWIELGVQSANDRTLEKIRRGHDFACVEDAVYRLHQRGIHCAAHVILGLPGETLEDYLYTARKIAALPFEAVKMHNLLILHNTAMEKMFRAGEVTALNEYEYAQALSEFLKILPDSMSVMRLNADAPPGEIVAPRWWMKKGQFREMFLAYFANGMEKGTFPFEFACKTGDGSYTYYHPVYRQHFHSTAGAETESVKKYLDACRIEEDLKAGKTLTVLEVGFGMGFNASALYKVCQENPEGKLHLVTLEFDEAVLQGALLLPEHPAKEMVRALKESHSFSDGNFSVELIAGDARKNILWQNRFDAIFLDGFSPEANPELWTLDFLQKLKDALKTASGRLATYSSAYPVVGALLQCGFSLYSSEPFGRKKGGLIASLDPEDSTRGTPLEEKDLRIATKSTAGTPYRDPALNAKRKEILARHKEEISRLRAQGIPKWYRDP